MTTTELYIIRHGLAGEHGTYENDGNRPLTPEGIRKTKQVAKRLLELDLQFELILTSPYARALQTAEILQSTGLSQQLETSVDLLPEGNFEAWFNWFEGWQSADKKALAIVGHEPGLGQWAELLIWGEVRNRLKLKKAGIMGINVPLDDPISNSELFWLVPPKVLL
ncbi:MAG: phosphohistidine phosphatase SixA [Timaviella obliquedivisa GSE-PSE-MK23-08B]|jgi:phosphohistidine phosphatase|nr:phosphohistidine phosphatase SixA [Timaviella obliquedivisa GSE-PSE-MK23-08B]